MRDLSRSKIGQKLPLVLIVLLLSAAFIGVVARPPQATAATSLSLTLVAENSYMKGQTIQISGTVKDQDNNPVSSGTVTVQLSCAGNSWRQKVTAQINNGAYSTSYQISYGNPAGTWPIAATAVDGSGNSGSASKSVAVTTPDNVVYLVQFLSPIEGSTKKRGENVPISASVTFGGVGVDDAAVSSNGPSGENITLTRIATGIYSATYAVKWGDPADNWSVSVEATKAANNRAGGTWLNVRVAAAALGVSLQSPTKTNFEAGESVEVRAAVSYPYGGGAAENATVSVNTPQGGSLTLTHQGSGVYGATYVVASQDAGTWNLRVSAADAHGNSGENSAAVYLSPTTVPSFFAKYWWAILAVLAGIGIAAGYAGRHKLLVGKLEAIKREKDGIPRLKKDAAMKYFREGSISRSAYDALIKKYDARMDELKRKEVELKAKLKKKAKK